MTHFTTPNDVPLLSIENLSVYFPVLKDGKSTMIKAVQDVSIDILKGEIVCVVGESGSGKSVTALSVLRLIMSPGQIDSSSRIAFEGKDLLALSAEEIRKVRGGRIGMIFQEPMSALNPVLTVGEQIEEVVLAHSRSSRPQAKVRALELLGLTGIPDPESRYNQYPHELSGGMRQRIMIAIALVMSPALVIADEPTTALDVTIQAQILDLLKQLRTELNTSFMLITHDIGVVAETADRVFVMYAGEVIERGSVESILERPHHPYTIGLLHAVPQVGDTKERLATIPGVVPAAIAWPHGCHFQDRCPYAWKRCEEEHPRLYNVSRASDGEPQYSRCHLADEPHRRQPGLGFNEQVV